jgi:hypothetical protein
MSRAAGVVATLLLLVTGASCSPSGRNTAPPKPTLPSGSARDRYHPNMSRSYGIGNHCDYVNDFTVARYLSYVGTGRNNPWGAARVRVLSVGGPRWNTVDGHRPTQAESDAMVDEFNIVPGIYRPVSFEVEHVYVGPVPPDLFTAYAETGRIGKDEVFSCAFGSAYDLGIREGPDMLMVGGRYVAGFSGSILNGRNDTAPNGMFTIDNLWVVHGDKVIDLAGKSDPLPQ